MVVVENVERRAEFLSNARRLTTLGLASLNERIVQKVPLGEWVLFGNDHLKIDHILRGLISSHENGDARLRFFELRENEPFDLESQARLEIPTTTLKNILED